jgi:hypothetical protein
MVKNLMMNHSNKILLVRNLLDGFSCVLDVTNIVRYSKLREEPHRQASSVFKYEHISALEDGNYGPNPYTISEFGDGFGGGLGGIDDGDGTYLPSQWWGGSGSGCGEEGLGNVEGSNYQHLRESTAEWIYE